MYSFLYFFLICYTRLIRLYICKGTVYILSNAVTWVLQRCLFAIICVTDLRELITIRFVNLHGFIARKWDCAMCTLCGCAKWHCTRYYIIICFSIFYHFYFYVLDPMEHFGGRPRVKRQSCPGNHLWEYFSIIKWLSLRYLSYTLSVQRFVYSKEKHNKFVHLKKKISLQAERRHGCTRVPGHAFLAWPVTDQPQTSSSGAWFVRAGGMDRPLRTKSHPAGSLSSS